METINTSLARLYESMLPELRGDWRGRLIDRRRRKYKSLKPTTTTHLPAQINRVGGGVKKVTGDWQRSESKKGSERPSGNYCEKSRGRQSEVSLMVKEFLRAELGIEYPLGRGGGRGFWEDAVTAGLHEQE